MLQRQQKPITPKIALGIVPLVSADNTIKPQPAIRKTGHILYEK